MGSVADGAAGFVGELLCTEVHRNVRNMDETYSPIQMWLVDYG